MIFQCKAGEYLQADFSILEYFSLVSPFFTGC